VTGCPNPSSLLALLLPSSSTAGCRVQTPHLEGATLPSFPLSYPFFFPLPAILLLLFLPLEVGTTKGPGSAVSYHSGGWGYGDLVHFSLKI